MRLFALLIVVAYSVNADEFFQRDISILEWRYWLPIGMMIVGFIDGLLQKDKN